MFPSHALPDPGYDSFTSLPADAEAPDDGSLSGRLRAGIVDVSADQVRAALDALIHRRPPLPSAALCAALAAASRDGDTMLHAAAAPGRKVVLDVLLDGIGTLARAGRIDPADLRRLLCAVNGEQESALHLLAHAPGAPGLPGFRDLLMRLHDDRRLPRDDVAAVVLQDSFGETPLQMALRHGGPVAIDRTLRLFAEALTRDAITPRQVVAALTASRTPDRGAMRRPPPLHPPFMLPEIACIQAIVAGVDALQRTGRMSAADLRSGMAAALDRGDDDALDSMDVMADRGRARALVQAARQRWFDDPAP
ncbi:hypothetical protein [Mitsuaria sp. GD03876]|uniref:hypothetical protein n=1 Tax=Mitsuaria sp. GD03876 TaxID=2975399 RepID=UPI00244B9C86|nr:hypothetical protein [Mitsuaria sp. GD03876]MDH0866118.1 hypothetical protein [Mitsuaria sp. GD03876]